MTGEGACQDYDPSGVVTPIPDFNATVTFSVDYLESASAVRQMN